MEEKLNKIKSLEDRIDRDIESAKQNSGGIIAGALKDSKQKIKNFNREMQALRKERLARIKDEIEGKKKEMKSEQEKELKEIEKKIKQNLLKAEKFLNDKLTIK